MRLDKFLVDCGLGTRSQVKDWIKKKRVRIGDNLASSPKQQLDHLQDQVFLDGHLLSYEKFSYYLLHKPADVISATEDPRHKTVLDLLDQAARQKAVFPVGRLDKDTTGLLLLTNNGPLAHAMLAPKKHVAKYYRARVAGIMDQADVATFAAGIELKDFICQPAKLEILQVNQADSSSLVGIELSEGKYHQVKRMVLACGKQVIQLERLSMGPLTLDTDLAPGDYRSLTADELSALEIFNVEL